MVDLEMDMNLQSSIYYLLLLKSMFYSKQWATLTMSKSQFLQHLEMTNFDTDKICAKMRRNSQS